MKYSIEFLPDQLQFIIDVLTKTSLPWEKVNPIISEVQAQVKEQEEVLRNPVSKVIEDSKK